VCEADDGGVRIVEERENSLFIQISCTSSADVKGCEPRTQLGFRGQGFHSQLRGRGRGHVNAVAENHTHANFFDRGLDFNSSSDLNSGIANKSQFEEEEEEAHRGGGRARGRWRGTGWRRGGAGRYFRQRYSERPDRTFDQRSHDKNFGNANDDASSPRISDTSVIASQDSNTFSVNTSGEQNNRSTHAENVASVNTDHRHFDKNVDSVRGMRSSNSRRAMNRSYIVRRSSTGRRRNPGFSAGPDEARAAVPHQIVTAKDKTSTVPRGSSDVCVTEDWDAECFQVEPTDNEPLADKAESNTTESHATLNSSSVSEVLGERPNESRSS